MGGDGAERELPQCNNFQTVCQPGPTQRYTDGGGDRTARVIITTLSDKYNERRVFGDWIYSEEGFWGMGRSCGLGKASQGNWHF